MGCCTCSLRTSSIVAAVFGISESCCSIIISAYIVSAYSPENVQKTILSTGGVPDESVINPNFGYSVFRDISASHIAFNAVWLVSTILLVVAIRTEQVLLHRQWTFVTLILTFTDVLLFIVLITELTMGISEFFNNIRVILLIIITSRGFSFYVVNIYMAVYVYQRGNEIFLVSSIREHPTEMQSMSAHPRDQQMTYPAREIGFPEQERNHAYNSQYI